MAKQQIDPKKKAQQNADSSSKNYSDYTRKEEDVEGGKRVTFTRGYTQKGKASVNTKAKATATKKPVNPEASKQPAKGTTVKAVANNKGSESTTRFIPNPIELKPKGVEVKKQDIKTDSIKPKNSISKKEVVKLKREADLERNNKREEDYKLKIGKLHPKWSDEKITKKIPSIKAKEKKEYAKKQGGYVTPDYVGTARKTKAVKIGCPGGCK